MAHGSSVSARDARRQRARFQVLFTSWLSGCVAVVSVSIILQQYTRFADVRRPSIRRCARHVTARSVRTTAPVSSRTLIRSSLKVYGGWPVHVSTPCSAYYGRPRAGHYIFVLWFLSIYLSIYLSSFSSPNLSGHRLDVYHTSTHGVALVRI